MKYLILFLLIAGCNKPKTPVAKEQNNLESCEVSPPEFDCIDAETNEIIKGVSL